MKFIPAEILTSIILRLSKENMFHCLTVNKKWYNICLPQLYFSMEITDDIKYTTRFVNCSKEYSRAKECIEYIKKLEVGCTKDNEMVQLLMHSPHIESVHFQLCLIRDSVLFGDKALPNIKTVTYSRRVENIEKIHQFFWTHRLTLENIDLSYKNYPQTFENIYEYIRFFPQLVHLEIELGPSMLLLDIIKDLPHLRKLTIANLKTSNLSNVSNEEFPRLNVLILSGLKPSPKITKNIKQLFPNIQKFKSIIPQYTSSSIELVEYVLDKKTIGEKIINIRKMDGASLCSILDSKIDFTGYDLLAITIEKVFDKDQQSFDLIGHTKQGRRWAHLQIECAELYPSIIRLNGPHAKRLFVHRLDFSLQEIQAMFPNLCVLLITGMQLSMYIDHTRTLSNLTTLFVPFMGLNQNVYFREIEQLCPNIRRLFVTAFELSSDDFSKKTVFYLPECQLKYFTFLTLPIEDLNVHVMAEGNGVLSKAWNIAAKDGDITVTEFTQSFEDMLSITPSPLFTFKSRTVEHVLTFGKYIQDD
ncbi:hypothetical protein BDB01DRAFT_811142 [Pilobolus umbonatus]|nr:hypothetical protein BDB01DRAFT_811142 [Pilobolus umbonatus]